MKSRKCSVCKRTVRVTLNLDLIEVLIDHYDDKRKVCPGGSKPPK